MWPFGKKIPVEKPGTKTVTTVICIPGKWAAWKDFILTLVEATGGDFMVAGNIVVHAKKQRHYAIEFCERDERLQDSFRVAGSVTPVSGSFLSEIGNHQQVIYISGKTGNLRETENIALAAAAVLKAGGLGIKIETTGKAFEQGQWFDLLEDFHEANLYKMFVLDSIVTEDGAVYSCGMHNLGLRDTIVSGEEVEQAINIIRTFGYYQIVDKPAIMNNQTFQAAINSQVYRITDEPNQPNKGHGLFENPYGMWRLTKE